MSEYRGVLREGLWSNNPGLVQLLGLCPLLAVTNTAVNGLALGLATAAVLVGSNVSVSLLRGWIAREVRIPAFVLIIASLVTAVELVMHGYFPELYGILGIFIPLIVTNCTILARAEAFASRNPPGRAAADGLAMGAGFAGVLVTLGALREVVGQGTLLADAELLLGPAAAGITLHLGDYPGFLLAVLPPGAFFGLAGLVALKKVIDQRAERPAPAAESAEAPAS